MCAGWSSCTGARSPRTVTAPAGGVSSWCDCPWPILDFGFWILAAARFHRPKVVLLDIGLPGKDGYAVARELLESPALCGTLLVAITGYGQDEDRERVRTAGFHHHLVKPVDPAALAAAGV